ncbi:MAG: 16S rRNA (uracil(1498)-N(3))-methyltransferase [Actinobacteria bacterium]|nr:16S rRNA (uracil(1498)-N(3))-methyltransferase [Actinomycetota bacterium]
MRKAHIILPSVPDRPINESGGIITVDGDDYHHLANVLRMKIGDRVVASSSNVRYETDISDISKSSITLRVNATSIIKRNPFYTSLILPVMAPDKMEYMVQKVTELGTDEIVLTFFNRCEHKASRANVVNRQRRLLKISREAVNQSFNDVIPTIKFAASLVDAVALMSGSYVLLAFLESGAEFTVGKAMSAVNFSSGGPQESSSSDTVQRKIVLVIGPEGSMDEGERNFLIGKGAFTVTINQNILRSETAAVAALAIVRNYELEQIKSCAGDI